MTKKTIEKPGPSLDWKQYAAGLLAALVLLPLPTYAAFNWTDSWTVAAGNTPVNVANNSSGFGEVTGQPDWLYIQPTVPLNTATSITVVRDFLSPAGPNQTISATAVLNGLNVSTGTNVQVYVWTTNTFGTQNVIYNGNPITPGPLTIAGNNMFLTNQSGTSSTPLQANLLTTVHVQFTINGANPAWSTSSTPTTIFEFSQP